MRRITYIPVQCALCLRPFGKSGLTFLDIHSKAVNLCLGKLCFLNGIRKRICGLTQFTLCHCHFVLASGVAHSCKLGLVDILHCRIIANALNVVLFQNLIERIHGLHSVALCLCKLFIRLYGFLRELVLFLINDVLLFGLCGLIRRCFLKLRVLINDFADTRSVFTDYAILDINNPAQGWNHLDKGFGSTLPNGKLCGTHSLCAAHPKKGICQRFSR